VRTAHRVVLLSGRAELARAQARRQNNQPGRRPWAALRLQAPRRGIEIAPAPAGGIRPLCHFFGKNPF